MEKKADNEKKRLENTKKLRISFNLLWSYLLILLAPVIAIVGIYATARTAMMDTQKERIQSMLSESELAFDREVKQAQNAGYYVSRERRLYDYLYKDSDGKDKGEFYSLYTLASNYPNYNLTNQIIKNVFIFIADSGYVVKIPQVIPQTEWGRATLGGFPFYSYETFMKFYKTQDKTQTLFFYENESKSKAFFIPSQVNYPYSISEKSAVVVELDRNQILQILKPVLAGEEGMVAIVDESDRILISHEDTRGGYSRAETGLPLEEYLDNNSWGRNNLEVFTKPTSYNGWKLVVTVPSEIMVEQIGITRYLAVALCVISIFIGVMVCLAYWHQRKTLVQEYFELQERIGVQREKNGKETMWFWRGFDKFLLDVDKLQDTLKKQEGVIREDVLRKILYGNYDSGEQVLEAAEQAGIPLVDKFYYVVDLEFEDPFRAGVECSREEFRKMQGDCLEKYLPYSYWRYQVSELSCVLLIQNDTKIAGEELKAALEKMNYEFYSKFKVQSYAGISRTANGPLEISRQFEIASRISEFARYRGIRVPVLPEELPKEQTQDQPLFFSIDMEMKLMNQIRSGSREQLEEMLEQIKAVYFRPGNSQYTYRHTIEILRGCLLRSIPAEDNSTEASELRKQAQKVHAQEEMFGLLRDTRQFCAAGNECREDVAIDLDREKVSSYIEKNFGDPCLNLSVMAEWLGKPERKIYSDFKLCFGMSFSSYLEQRRISHACELLKTGMAVKDTAEKVGYSSDYSFRRAFKRVVGIPPSDFRKM